MQDVFSANDRENSGMGDQARRELIAMPCLKVTVLRKNVSSRV